MHCGVHVCCKWRVRCNVFTAACTLDARMYADYVNGSCSILSRRFRVRSLSFRVCPRNCIPAEGENNAYGTMGNSKDGTGYGCELPAMVNNWRDVWDAEDDALFGIATLAAGGSEGTGWHMAGMRWSQTANYGVWDNPALPNSFGAQVYDLADPWVRSNTCQSNRIPATMWWYFCIDMYLVVFICWHVLTRARLHPPRPLSHLLGGVLCLLLCGAFKRVYKNPDSPGLFSDWS